MSIAKQVAAGHQWLVKTDSDFTYIAPQNITGVRLIRYCGGEWVKRPGRSWDPIELVIEELECGEVLDRLL